VAHAGLTSLDTQSRLLDLLFRGQHEDGDDVSDQAFLLRAARAVGLDTEVVRVFLGRERVGDVIDLEVNQASAQGITAVPAFTIQGKYRVNGYQEPDIFLSVFDKAREEMGDGSIAPASRSSPGPSKSSRS